MVLKFAPRSKPITFSRPSDDAPGRGPTSSQALAARRRRLETTVRSASRPWTPALRKAA